MAFSWPFWVPWWSRIHKFAELWLSSIWRVIESTKLYNVWKCFLIWLNTALQVCHLATLHNLHRRLPPCCWIIFRNAYACDSRGFTLWITRIYSICSLPYSSHSFVKSCARGWVVIILTFIYFIIYKYNHFVFGRSSSTARTISPWSPTLRPVPCRPNMVALPPGNCRLAKSSENSLNAIPRTTKVRYFIDFLNFIS